MTKYCCNQMKGVIRYPAKMDTGNSILSLEFKIEYDVKMIVSDEYDYFVVYFKYCPFCGKNLKDKNKK